MFFTTLATLALAASGTSALSNSVGNALGIKKDSMISYDRIYFGYAPNYNPRVTMASLNKATGQKGATYNVYSQITSDNVNSGSYNGNYQYNVDDIVNSGAVLIASLMPTVQWTGITPNLCSSVNDYFTNTFTNKGVTVWLRFAHEMNYYATDGTYPGGVNYGQFLKAWDCMYEATKNNNKISMFWSPNYVSDASALKPWFPPANQVDIVGMDYYPSASSASGLPSFDTAYGGFYNTFAKPYNLPFAIAETGTQNGGGSASVAQKEAWLKTILNRSAGYGAYPLYTSATWFEYGPDANSINYYVVYGQSSSTVTQTISNTEEGS
ncbi:glycoside hydrolase family 26 protein [Dissoconium aciculare CBS 342.82]|uniref:Glycoside hydrolase family 26 protein n=1 Tax=Dissoconium aciculare CBS 342.82 TaxID=1314786 RepID=A0A6J3LUB2_9PEZI|nr:glycoside hydrolase family 26 protein [Dissoconium aciculare CBS 342.82]KAF1819233.1 glycoside hydrolase family 26 protein [Dissoconium aciculare CBS 342.82]